jgi:hypothetical protein
VERGTSVLFSTGTGADYDDGRLNDLSVRAGGEVKLFRAVCEAEYISIIENENKFIPYEYAMGKKWFATCRAHAKKWGDWFYPDCTYKIIEITVLEESLKYMFYLKSLDDIGAAYAADEVLLNKIVRGLRLV